MINTDQYPYSWTQLPQNQLCIWASHPHQQNSYKKLSYRRETARQLRMSTYSIGWLT